MTKLMPIAGILAMLLSLGGSLVPSQASEYNPSDTYSYEGMMSTSVVVNKFINETPREVQLNERNKNPSDVSDKFAALEKEVRHRQQNPPAGGGHHGNIWLGVFTQLGLLAALLVTLWYAQLGAVILWWCQVDSRSQLQVDRVNFSVGYRMDVLLVHNSRLLFAFRELCRDSFY